MLGGLNDQNAPRPSDRRSIRHTPDFWVVALGAARTMIRADFGRADRDRCARRDFAMVYLMGRLGLRREETRELQWGDLHGTGDPVTLTVHGKGDKYAGVHVPHDVQEVLQSWREALATAVGHVPGPGSPIFPVLGGAHRYAKERTLPLSVFSVGAIVRRRMIDAGFDGPRYGAHALRATAATVAHENGADLLAISRLLRHANPKTTERYIKTSENRRTSAAESWLGPVFAVVLGVGHRPHGAFRG